MADDDKPNLFRVPPDWREAASLEYRDRRARLIEGRDRFSKQAQRYMTKVADAEKEIQRLDDGARAFGFPLAEIVEKHEQEVRQNAPFRSGPLFKNVALDLLEKAYPKPLRAAEIQEKAEHQLGRKFHSKTSGMTLYRLAQDELIERRGWDWFYIPEEERERRNAHAEEVIEAIFPKTK